MSKSKSAPGRKVVPTPAPKPPKIKAKAKPKAKAKAAEPPPPPPKPKRKGKWNPPSFRPSKYKRHAEIYAKGTEPPPDVFQISTICTIDTVKRLYAEWVLRQLGGDRLGAAKAMGISDRSMYNWFPADEDQPDPPARVKRARPSSR